MRWNFRLRTLLIVVAVTSLPLGYAAVTWQNGGFAIQYDYATLATIHEKLARVARYEVEYYEPHADPTHSCPVCFKWRRPVSDLIDASQRDLLENERNFRWYLRLAGPKYYSSFDRGG